MLRRFSVFSLAFLLCLSLFPARALADVGNASVLWSGSVNGGAQYGAFVKGGTNYDAAVAALGYDSSRLSSEVKTRLADESYSGYFYTFATSFQRVSTPFDIPSWVPVFVSTGSVIADLWNNISGSSYPHWSVEVVSVLYDLALRDFKAVLAGEDLSGGGDSGGGVDGYVSVSVGVSPSDSIPYGGWYLKTTDNSVYTSYVDAPSAACVLVPESDFSNLSSLSSTYSKCCVCVESTHNNVNRVHFMFYNDGDMTYLDDEHASLRGFASSGYVVHFTSSDVSIDSSGMLLITCSFSSQGRQGSFGNFNPSIIYWKVYEGGFTAPVLPPAGPSGVWPDPDVPAAPVAPELPEPADPVVEVPETPVTPSVPTPVWPDITINIDNDPTPGTTPSGLDYTELLTRINDNLISIDSFARAINSNLNSLRGDLLAEFNGVYDSLRNIYNYLLTIDSVLETHCTHLRNKIEQSAVFIANYMRTLIKWLAEQLDYDDLTNVEAPDNSLLTTINEKLGGGTYEPNPIKDEQGYYEWLDDLWDRFLLGDNWQTSMGNISGSFSELKTRFPFSVPWDIVALFRLFVHDPVTPVFDLPLYFSADGSTSVHVDLSPWDSVASLVRPMIFVIFALKLALLSRDLLGGLGADKGGL